MVSLNNGMRSPCHIVTVNRMIHIWFVFKIRKVVPMNSPGSRTSADTDEHPLSRRRLVVTRLALQLTSIPFERTQISVEALDFDAL